MEKTTHLVMQKTNEFPTGLKDAAEMAKTLTISEQRLSELAESGYVPHYRVDGGQPLFRASEVKQWLSENLVTRAEGRPLPQAIRLVIPAPPVSDRPPLCIANIKALQQLPKHGYQPGVYFLCKNDEVVYVGQSVSPASRISAHCSDRHKDYDRVYLMPVPESELNDVEAAFIHHLRPSQQGGIKSGRQIPTSPGMTRPINVILKSIGYEA